MDILWENLGKLLAGEAPPGWKRYFISIHPEFHNADISEIKKLAVSHITDEQKKFAIRKDFMNAVSWIGNCPRQFVATPEIPRNYDTEYFEVLTRPSGDDVSCEDLVSKFPDEKDLPASFVSPHGFFATYSCDMTIILFIPEEISQPPRLETIYFYEA